MKKLLIILVALFSLAAVRQFSTQILVTQPDGTLVKLILRDPAPLPNPPPGSGGGVIAMPPSTQFEINGGALMTPMPGFSTLRVQPTAEIPHSDPNHGAFRINCQSSHQGFYDPIVYPGQPGRSHLHQFFGNTAINPDSTNATLAATGNSTCTGGIMNRSGYWIPAMIDITTGFPVTPTGNLVYYKTDFTFYFGAARVASITTPPVGLRMIAGSAANSSLTAGIGVYKWECWVNSVSIGGSQSIPGTSCPNNGEVVLLLNFPMCWDGVNLDSTDHQSHMAYPSAATGCPGTHPVVIPHISYNIHYAVKSTSRPENWRLSSDVYSLGLPAGLSAHGDWMNGWRVDATDDYLNVIVTNCVKALKDCGASLLGDGRLIF